MFKQGGIVLSREKVRTQVGLGKKDGTCECGWDEEGSGLHFSLRLLQKPLFTNDYSRGWPTLHISLAPHTLRSGLAMTTVGRYYPCAMYSWQPSFFSTTILMDSIRSASESAAEESETFEDRMFSPKRLFCHAPFDPWFLGCRSWESSLCLFVDRDYRRRPLHIYSQ